MRGITRREVRTQWSESAAVLGVAEMRDLVGCGRAGTVGGGRGAGGEMREGLLGARDGGTGEKGRSEIVRNLSVLIGFGQEFGGFFQERKDFLGWLIMRGLVGSISARRGILDRIYKITKILNWPRAGQIGEWVRRVGGIGYSRGVRKDFE
ncbi:MAG: hypothetical protein JW936_05095 [Sedimentisphaerales bacterium]|nr:hypothetical protein [Sedimentisphaerales bacterium]